MAFRRRNVVVAQSQAGGSSQAAPIAKQALPPGVRPSPLDGRLTTSTGTRSLDSLLAGHAGLALGTSLLIEESGTTDFSGSLLRYYAAEGVIQGHAIHVLGMHEQWGKELPGLSGGDSSSKSEERRGSEDKMKIAWRYERLGEFGAGARDRNQPQATGSSTAASAIFCHDFDLSKRLILPSPSPIKFVPVITRPNFDFRESDASKSPFTAFVTHLTAQLSASPTTVHKVVIPSLLSPAIYPPESSRPEHLLQFLHSLRALLRKYPAQLTAVISIPLTLYPRSTGLTRWMELLSDGVLELSPFPSSALATKTAPGAATVHEEPPQGMLKIHRLPIFHEKGGGGGEASGFGDDLAFILSRRKGLVIKPYSLPPVEGDAEAQQVGMDHGHDHGKATKVDIEF